MSSFSLKILATILMIIDHLAYFWYDFFPLWFRWLGCASAPIFIFCLVHSYDKTHSKAKLMIRLYLFSVCMAVINIILMCLGYIIAGDTVASIDLRSFKTKFQTDSIQTMVMAYRLCMLGKLSKQFAKLQGRLIK